MLAYVFWHQPADETGYEAALHRFHEVLAADPPAGFVASRTSRIGGRPWLPGGGYEDWYLIDDYTALGVLNAAAVDAAHRPTHDAVAGQTRTGTAGLYLHRRGDWRADGPAEWSAQPPTGPGTVWQRQLVLGPTPEYCLISSP